MFVNLFSVLTYLSSFTVGCTASDRISRRIVEGFEVDIESFPYAVFLYFALDRPSSCGSSLITFQAVLTSAHCLKELKFEGGSIHAFLGSSIPMESTHIRNISSYIVHHRYNPRTAKFDLGVAKFDRPVSMKEGIHKIPIYRKSLQNKAILYTAGWGKKWPNIVPDYSIMRGLKASKQQLTDTQECLNMVGAKASTTFLCTLPLNGHHYRGDFGNGLVVLKPFLALVGVVSFTVRSATLYANVLDRREWLREALTKLYGEKPLDKDCC